MQFAHPVRLSMDEVLVNLPTYYLEYFGMEIRFINKFLDELPKFSDYINICSWLRSTSSYFSSSY
jgi:hypothetical protein